MGNTSARIKGQSVKSDSAVNEWSVAFREMALNRAEIVPKGWINANELSAMFHKHRKTISEYTATMLQQGKVEIRKFRIMTGRGIYPVPHYKLKT